MAKASIVNILEEEVEELGRVSDADGFSLGLSFKAFEIKTVRLELT